MAASSISNAMRIASGDRGGATDLPSGGGNLAEHVTGGLASAVPGRTDHLPISVPDGAYIIPADVVSALGEGNTQAGIKVLNALVTHSGPPPARKGTSVDIAAAGGEYVVPPQVVAELGRGSIDNGHTVLDAFVKRVRSQTSTKLKSLKGPVRNR